MNFYKLMKITIILLAFLTVGIYYSFAQNPEEKPQDSTDTALVDGVKVIQDTTNEENTVSETTEGDVETMEDQGLEVEVDEDVEVNTVQEIEPDAGQGPNPDLLVPQPRINLESNLDKPLYNPTGKRDPFKPFIKTPKEKGQNRHNDQRFKEVSVFRF